MNGGVTRRHLLRLAPAFAWPLASGPAHASAPPVRLALAWDERDGTGAFAGRLAPAAASAAAPSAPHADPRRCVGVWALHEGRFELASRLVVPTRAHGLIRLPGDELLAVARRPGLWMCRWSADGRRLHEAWAEPGRQFNGHAVLDVAAGVLYSTEQRLDDGAGVLAVRDPITLALRAEWPTGGTDPHAVRVVGDTVYVANGGVPTRAESGRARDGSVAVDSSLVAFERGSGRLRGRWRLPDAGLSLRHLAWHAGSASLGIALQAEHDDPALRVRAPLLAVLDRQGLRALALPPAPPGATDWSGYAGDIAATADGFRLGATRAGAVLDWSVAGGWGTPRPLAQACAQAADDATPGLPWSLGQVAALAPGAEVAVALPPGCTPDNHALWLPTQAAAGRL